MKSCEDCFYHRSVTPDNYHTFEECKLDLMSENGLNEAEYCSSYVGETREEMIEFIVKSGGFTQDELTDSSEEDLADTFLRIKDNS